jgi:hypothetical protein
VSATARCGPPRVRSDFGSRIPIRIANSLVLFLSFQL